MPWFEDIEIGSRTELGNHTFEADEIIAFAKKYDPQYFHVDAEAAKHGPFGTLTASGWHTSATWMKLMIASRRATPEPADENGRTPPAGGPSPGFLEMKWPNPVRAGDTISYSSEVIEKLDMRSRPGWGIVRSLNIGVNQHGETVMSFIGQGLIERRAPKGA
ncbi:MaoC family dehydratase [Parvibaculum sp.]|jgi:acyl dehydratase|uniref:MaoC family dehydratase n=1 Tax=Parvibaculum sp. TaxID=2024848 RepID=UPI003299E906